jgi:hypothetical protein
MSLPVIPAAVAIEALRVDCERYRQERDRYKRERDELLAALFTSYDTRLHLSAILLGATDAKQESLPRQAGQSQSG